MGGRLGRSFWRLRSSSLSSTSLVSESEAFPVASAVAWTSSSTSHSSSRVGPTMLDSGISVGTVTGDGQPTAMSNLIPAGANISQSDAMLLHAWRALGEIPDLADFGMGVDSMMDGPIDLFS